MKNMLRFACTACAAAIVSTQTLPAQTWQTVLDYQLAAGKGAGGDAIVADAGGNVFSSGSATDDLGTNHAIVLKTDTTQADWYFSDDTNPDPTQYHSSIYDLGLDAHGNVYSIGQLWPNNTSIPPYWYVRKSSNGGVNWSTVDLYQYTPGQWAWATGFAADSSGSIYVVGAAHSVIVLGPGKKGTPQTILHRLVRKSSDGGQSWTVVDDVTNTPAASGATAVPGVGVFVVGQYFPQGPWLVRRSVTGDVGTWSTVDGPISKAAAHGACGDSLGNVYVVGTQFIATGVVRTKGTTVTNGYYAWVTRKSSDGGDSWSTDDTFSYGQNTGSYGAIGIGRNAAGNVVVVGRATDGQNKGHWIVRTPDSSGAWQTVDDFQLAPGYDARAGGVATDAAGNLLVTGSAQDATGNHWIVRRLANTSP